MDSKVHVAMVGVGYWGPNILRTLSQIPNVSIRYICDLNTSKLKNFGSLYPEVTCTSDLKDVLKDETVDAVFVATAAPSHYAIAKQILLAGKHVYVEKPLTLNVEEAFELVQLAKSTNKKLMVGHLLMYHPAVTFMKEYIQTEEFGDLRYIYSTRVNLGKVRAEENALWSLAPHDISVILYLMNALPLSVEATGESYLRKDVEDVVFCHLKFPHQMMAHIHVSWLDPHKVRQMTVVGTKKMIVFDDMSPKEKIKIYDKSFEPQKEFETYDEEYLSLVNGGVTIPALPKVEPLLAECEHFIDCIVGDLSPKSDGVNGCEVLAVLKQAQSSLQERHYKEME